MGCKGSKANAVEEFAAGDGADKKKPKTEETAAEQPTQQAADPPQSSPATTTTAAVQPTAEQGTGSTAAEAAPPVKPIAAFEDAVAATATTTAAEGGGGSGRKSTRRSPKKRSARDKTTVAPSSTPPQQQSPTTSAPAPAPAPAAAVPTTQQQAAPEAGEPQTRVQDGVVVEESRNRMFAVLKMDPDEFKPRSRQGRRRAPAALVQRLEADRPASSGSPSDAGDANGSSAAEGDEEAKARAAEEAAALAAKMEAAARRREEERERRRQRGAREVEHVGERRRARREEEEKKAEDLKRMIQSRTRVAENNRESGIGAVKHKQSGHAARVDRAKSKPRSSALGDLPPIGRGSLLAPDVPEQQQRAPAESGESGSAMTSPHTPANLSGIISPGSQSPKKPQQQPSSAGEETNPVATADSSDSS